MELQCKEDMFVVGYDDNDGGGGNNVPHQVVFSSYYCKFLPKALFFTLKKKI